MAGYNNYFPQTYTNSPYVYSAASQPGVSWAQPTTTSSQLSSINWVQGEAGARSVPVPAGQKALLMDSETNVFYVKSFIKAGCQFLAFAFVGVCLGMLLDIPGQIKELIQLFHAEIHRIH